jgi:hypothetical protein
LKPQPQNPEPETWNPLAEYLSWLEYCLGEAAAAAQAVKAAAEARRTGIRTAGRDACATGGIDYHAVCELAAQITTLRGRVSRWNRESHGLDGS